MSRLLELINRHISETGLHGRAKLCQAVGKSERTLLRWLREGVPTAHDAYLLAKAAGASKEEAHKIAKECFPAKETA